jgi:hypothetical protein
LKLARVVPETGEARWFDFDLAHAPGLAAAWRHDDDLRALVYSAVESFADLPVSLLLRTVQDAFADPGPWEQLRDRLARGEPHRSPWHLAQACLPDGRRRELHPSPLWERTNWRALTEFFFCGPPRDLVN